MEHDVRERIIAFLPRLRRFAYSLTGDWEQTDDLVQDTCERALARLHQWRQGTSLESWMFRIAQNLWKDGIKAKKVRDGITHLDTVPEVIGSDGRREMDGRLTLSAVMKAISTLPAEQRLIVALICIDERSYKEAAEILDIPVGTVMSRLARARQALYTAIHDDVPGSTSSKFGNQGEQGGR